MWLIYDYSATTSSLPRQGTELSEGRSFIGFVDVLRGVYSQAPILLIKYSRLDTISRATIIRYKLK